MTDERTQRALRQKMERATSRLERYERFRALTRFSITLALGGLFGALILGPYGLIPAEVAWGVGVAAPIVFGGISITLFCYIEDTFGQGSDVMAMRHDVENATEEYFASLRTE